jgi:hypothetical protein
VTQRAVVVGAVAVAWLLVSATAVIGQTPTARVISMDTIVALFAVVGDGTNSIAVGEDEGVILIGAKSPGWGKILVEKVGLGTENPITSIIHTSASTAGSTPEIPTAREIIAHENTSTYLAGMAPFTGPGAKFLPSRTFKDTFSVPIKTKADTTGNNRVDLYYVGPARTNGDVIAVLPAFRMAVVGEVFPAKTVPVIDRRLGGSAVALPDTVSKASAILEKAGIRNVVPGRAAPPPTPFIGTWFTLRDLQEYAAFTRDILGFVTSSFQAGKNIDAAVAAFVIPEKYPKYTAEHVQEYVTAVYDELGKR